MPYPYDQVFAADPATPENVASNGVVTIFAPGDPDRTPLTITTLDGLPLPNPMQVNDAGFGPAFMHATLDQVAWAGGGFSGLFVSYKGIKDEAVAARVAAETAASGAAGEVSANLQATKTAAQTAATSAQGAAASASNALAEATTARKAAEAAAASAAGATGGAAIAADPSNPGLYFVAAGGQIKPDPANPGLYLVGA